MKTPMCTPNKKTPHLIMGGTLMKQAGGAGPTVGKAILFLAFVMVSTNCSLAVEGISESALGQIRAFQQEKAARTPAQQKLDSQIVYALRQSRNELGSYGITNVHPN